MKKKRLLDIVSSYCSTIIKALPRFRLKPALITLTTFLILVVILVGQGNINGEQDIEIGRVAERDVVADQSVSYIDEQATALRLSAQQHLVPAVFMVSAQIDKEIRVSYSYFVDFSRELLKSIGENILSESYRFAVQSAFPGIFSYDLIDSFFQDPDKEAVLSYSSILLERIINTGIFALPQTGLEQYNPDIIEVLSETGSRELLSRHAVITLDNLENSLPQYSVEGEATVFQERAFNLIRPFLKENVFFSVEQTAQRVADVQVDPVIKYIEQGKRIIRKGFIVTEEAMYELQAINEKVSIRDVRVIIGQILILVLLYGLFVLLGSGKVWGIRIRDSEMYLLTALTFLYLVASAFVRTINLPYGIPSSVMLPTALVIMLPSLLINTSLAVGLSLVLPLASFFSGMFDVSAYLFALVSGVVASIVLHKTEKRMDIIQAGLIIACANCVAMLAVLLSRRSATDDYFFSLFWAAFNGVMSGIIVIGILPPLEQALNAVTKFRLRELSDLNAPLLKRLFTAAPGTYSHSIMVANLSEAACEEIGANSLLARVGAYYHDIGKMEQPLYFVENQEGGHNPQDDIPPRLSATIIRSHVRLGVEKARTAGLPQPIINIIAEHHGNSVISYFYRKALEQDPNISIEDFSYPGAPPKSKESAVVMLADTCEAAARTLEKPTAEAIEKFIQKLINDKVEHRQLIRSALTFGDLEVIKKSFVRVLAAYYHARIKYPDAQQQKPETPPPPQK
ncbi:MAG: HDIG domain-containing protein [Treponema sp.]|jgi:putative nucleotidyltransferase with HDIG domain|nr:HDIG domain-containing protein [Treponema sp.]